MKNLNQLIRRPVITERASDLQEKHQKYVFEVHSSANKIDIQRAIESQFDVDVTKVNTISVHGKVKRMGLFDGSRDNWKKAVVTLAEGQSIDLFEG